MILAGRICNSSFYFVCDVFVFTKYISIVDRRPLYYFLQGVGFYRKKSKTDGVGFFKFTFSILSARRSIRTLLPVKEILYLNYVYKHLHANIYKKQVNNARNLTRYLNFQSQKIDFKKTIRELETDSVASRYGIKEDGYNDPVFSEVDFAQKML